MPIPTFLCFPPSSIGSCRGRVASAWLPVFLLVAVGGGALRAAPLPEPKPVPAMQAVPLPDSQVSFQRDGLELCRLYHGAALNRPFLYPILGPSGRSLTRMGHPHDPVTHSHHNSVWISHTDVEGVNFWDDEGRGRIVHRRVERLDDGMNEASALTSGAWLATSNQVVLLAERRLTSVVALPERQWLLIIDLELTAPGREVTLGRTPFGPIGVRMARSLGVNDGGGRIRNSAGGVNEAGCFWKPARWVDYSGPITPSALEGITLMDHPLNPGHPNVFHVRDDGWMGASVSYAAPLVVAPGKPLRLRYGLWVHAGAPDAEVLDFQWKAFVERPIPAIAGPSAK